MMTRSLLTVKEWLKSIDIPVRFLILQVVILSVITLAILL